MTSLPRPVELAVVASLLWGLAAVGLLALNFGNAGGVVALVQHCFLVGLPLTMVLGASTLRSNRTMIAMSFALSMAISAMSAQLMIVFSLAQPVILVVAATLYGIGLALAALAVTSSGPDLERSGEESARNDDMTRWRDTRELAVPRTDQGTPVPVPPQLRPPEGRSGQ